MPGAWAAPCRGRRWRRKESPLPSLLLLPWPSKLLEFLDVLDDPVLGYLPPTVITVLHTHLFSCAVDYRYPGWEGPVLGKGAGFLHVRSLPQPDCDPQTPLPPCACPHHR